MSLASLRGRLLVAMPVLQDPNFERTVTLLLEHTEEGALGLVLNRPSDTELDDPLPEWGPLAAEPPVVFVGGPVALDGAIGLARATDPVPSEGWAPLFDDLGTVDLRRSPEDIEAPLEGLRVFLGHAGWGPGQLEAELDEDSWIIEDARRTDVFTEDPEDLWSAVLRRKGREYVLLATMPMDPSQN
jgi:putative transcriptional regulator